MYVVLRMQIIINIPLSSVGEHAGYSTVVGSVGWNVVL